ncbi:MAG: 50S ribosomal protein L23 [Bacteroidota bacterium]
MNILIKPIITEKMTATTEKLNRYGFYVSPKANKLEIKSAIEEMYGVSVVAINTIKYVGKLKARNTKSGLTIGRTNAFKKAIVKLSEGETIDFFSNI